MEPPLCGGEVFIETKLQIRINLRMIASLSLLSIPLRKLALFYFSRIRPNQGVFLFYVKKGAVH